MRTKNRIFGTLAILAFAAAANMARAAEAPPTPPPAQDNNAFPDFGYHEVPGWATLPGGRKWGGISGIDIDRDGKSVWVFDRCEDTDGGCAVRPQDDPIIKLDQNGKLVKSFGKGLIAYAHGIYVDARDHVWIADGLAKSGAKGDVVREFDSDGKLLRTMGEFGVPGTDTAHFDGVSDVVIAPNGDIFVADGHDNKTNNRMLKFDRNGKFIKQWGKLGSGPGEFNSPHGLAMDKEGRIYVADRSNSRIQIFDQDGNYLTEWKQFGRPSGIYIDKKDTLYVADSLSSPQNNPGFKNGIRWGSIKDGKVVGFIPWGEYNAIEAVVTDDAGNIYAGFTNVPNFRKFSKN
ncbi:MAG TPA: peptidyl-alpha-hydroxyglycine alpha-amidating lyase family protein [Rhizomicrobium sp.]|nr:peptidyl-alpha-hydroxyglycine alpha-amidating lyase family protein [Rhizomicrobium sp.]